MPGCPAGGETVLYIIRAPAVQFLSAQPVGKNHFLETFLAFLDRI
jgi:hypothetical protein